MLGKHTIAVTVLLLGMIIQGQAACLTKHEARHKYQTSFLFWHTEHHCWDDRRHNVRHWPAAHNEARSTPPRHQARAAPQEPAGKADVGTSIWPDPTVTPTWRDRWSAEGSINPARWLQEAYAFGRH